MLNFYDDNTKPPIVTNAIRQSWNDYTSWLEAKGLRGNPALDTNDLGNQMLNQYIRENPLTPLRPEHIKPIQEDFKNYRQFALDQIKSGKAAFAEGVSEDNFMPELSKTDGWSGSMTTKHKFAREYLNYLDEKGRLEKTEDNGFAQTNQ